MLGRLGTHFGLRLIPDLVSINDLQLPYTYPVPPWEGPGCEGVDCYPVIWYSSNLNSCNLSYLFSAIWAICLLVRIQGSGPMSYHHLGNVPWDPPKHMQHIPCILYICDLQTPCGITWYLYCITWRLHDQIWREFDTLAAET